MEGAPRILLISTPRAGNNWLRRTLAGVYDIPQIAMPTAAEIDWEALPHQTVVGVHVHPTPRLRSAAERFGFTPVVLARHPLDVLISILHFALHHSDDAATQRWLGGEGGNERGIFGAMPSSAAFAHYGTSARARALLAVSHAWWGVPGAIRVRYEELLEDPEGTVRRLALELGVDPRRDVEQVLAQTNLTRLREITGATAHFWQGQAGLWRRLLTAADAAAIAAAHGPVFSDLGYECDPDPELDSLSADTNWIGLLYADIGEDLSLLRNNRIALRTVKAELGSAQSELEGLRTELATRTEQFAASQAELAIHRTELATRTEQFTNSQARIVELEGIVNRLLTHLESIGA